MANGTRTQYPTTSKIGAIVMPPRARSAYPAASTIPAAVHNTVARFAVGRAASLIRRGFYGPSMVVSSNDIGASPPLNLIVIRPELFRRRRAGSAALAEQRGQRAFPFASLGERVGRRHRRKPGAVAPAA